MLFLCLSSEGRMVYHLNFELCKCHVENVETSCCKEFSESKSLKEVSRRAQFPPHPNVAAS